MGEKVDKKIIFISGPSDAYKEMDLIKKAIESLNKVFCPPLKIVLEAAMGSTHAMAGAGRPQSRINPWVEECDLFIGVYKKRFGTSTGRYSSGIEEEFRIAFERNQKSNGNPEIFLFFKNLSKKKLKDMGPQLEKLLKFKEDIRQHVFYKTYSTRIELVLISCEQIIQWIYTNMKINQNSNMSLTNEVEK